ncbi:hypothetical protein IQ07DRAFT_678376 [Pyrenochaeta sp. DS3sAY3a]|nr:hypothetical protein IQ07DRAFT_678376 [Pyrenochaeta sp. DS3sAY3a]
MSTLSKSPRDSIAENCAIVFNYVVSLWFQVSDAPFKKFAISQALHLDRVNALVKVYDRSPTDINPTNKNRLKSVRHVKGRARTMEDAKQSASTGNPLLPRSHQEEIREQRRNVLGSIYRDANRI